MTKPNLPKFSIFRKRRKISSRRWLQKKEM